MVFALFSYHISTEALMTSLPSLSLCKPSPSLHRHLGLDLVPRKEFEMVDPDQISISELYKLVCGVELFYKAMRSAQCCSMS